MRWDGFLDDYRAPKPAQAHPHPIPEGMTGVVEMLAACNGHVERTALVALTGLMGLRVTEARLTTVDDFNLNEMTLYVRGKGDRHHIIPISDAAWQNLMLAYQIARVREDGNRRLVRWSDRGARWNLTRIAKLAELSRDVSSHDMRATFLTAAYAKTKDLLAVQRLAGHASSRTTEIYTDVPMTTMRNAADLI